LGEILAKTEKAKAGRPKKIGRGPRPISQKPATLKEAGITKDLSSRAQKLANIPDEKFEAKIAEAKESEKPLSYSTFAQELEIEKPHTEDLNGAALSLASKLESISELMERWTVEKLMEAMPDKKRAKSIEIISALGRGRWSGLKLISLEDAERRLIHNESSLNSAPPAGSKWTLAGWRYALNILHREPKESEWDLYQKNRL
jgi:hypothetical protein